MKPKRPPIAPQRPKELQHLGVTRTDPWYWLRDRDDPAVMAYLSAENAYTDAVMESSQALQEALYMEMRLRIQEDDATVPEKEGAYFYYRRYRKDAQYPIYCRKQGSQMASEEVLLDVNTLAEGQSYLRLGVCTNSPDHRYLAYSADVDGSEAFTLRILDLSTGRLLPEQLSRTYYSMEWAHDSQTFFYTVLDEHHRPVRVYRHRLGQDPAQDPLVYEEKDPRFFLSLTKSESGRFIYLCCHGNNMSEWHYLNRRQPTSKFVLIEPRQRDHEYEVSDHGKSFFIRTNLGGARDFKVMKVDIDEPVSQNWVDLIPHRPGTLITDLVLFQDYLVVCETTNALPQIKVIRLRDSNIELLQFDEEAYDVRVQPGREFSTTTLRLAYTSLATPERIFDYDMATGERILRKQEPVLSDFDCSNYVSRRLYAKSRDGADIPISLCHRRDTPLDGRAPLVLYGYGSYGHSIPASFSRVRLSYLDRGFIYAIAHIRGGMECGYQWYEDGKLLKKRNTFEDYIACAEHLIDNKFASKGEILGVGGSAGGLLMGTVANMRPDLFEAIIVHVPFVDLVSTMLD
ncbi:MAG: S9 family peptidase, partial [Acidiferrobacterales bacterium]|nr:S9 family peptidase [Acidiferrobacterales bacterium]